MHLYQVKKREKIRILLMIFVFAIMIFFVGVYSQNAQDSIDNEQLRTLQEAIRSSAVECYATEGIYPEQVEYLEEHYGIQIDNSKYVVIYEYWGANLCPMVRVNRKGD